MLIKVNIISNILTYYCLDTKYHEEARTAINARIKYWVLSQDFKTGERTKNQQRDFHFLSVFLQKKDFDKFES